MKYISDILWGLFWIVFFTMMILPRHLTWTWDGKQHTFEWSDK